MCCCGAQHRKCSLHLLAHLGVGLGSGVGPVPSGKAISPLSPAVKPRSALCCTRGLPTATRSVFQGGAPVLLGGEAGELEIPRGPCSMPGS